MTNDNNKPIGHFNKDKEKKLIQIVIEIEPNEFINKIQHNYLFEIKDKWFVNLTTQNIPDNVTSLIQLGANFSIPSHNKKYLLEIIKDVENNLRFFNKKQRNQLEHILFPH